MSKEELARAISDRSDVEFVYSEEVRTVEPHLLGINAAGTLTLSAWQVTGRCGWRAYSVNKISALQITEESFTDTRPGYNPNDSTMSQIIERCS